MVRECIQLLCQHGRQALAQQDPQLACRYYMAALTLKDDEPEAHHGLATVHFMLNDLEGAAHHFTQVTRYDPTRAGAYINLGAIYNQLDRLDEAIQVLRRGIQLDPHRGEGYYNLGLAHRRQGQNDLAVQAYLEALRVNPSMADAHFNLANIYLDSGRHGQAIVHYHKALELRPQWDKAEDGLVRAEAGQAGVKLPEDIAAPPPPTPEPRPEAAAPPPVESGRILDPTRLVDPNLQAAPLKELHQHMIEADTDGRQLALVLHDTVEPAVKDLSACLLMVNKPISELEERIRKFEKAVRDLRKVQQGLHDRMAKIQASGERLLES